MRKNIIVIPALLLFWCFCSSCRVSHDLDSPYLKTPGAMFEVYPPEVNTFQQLADWSNDPDQLLLVKGSSGEYASEPFDITFFNWKTGEINSLNIIEKNHRVDQYAAQGKTGIIAFNDSGTLYLYNPITNSEIIVDEYGYRPDFSPDGEQLAYWVDGNLWVTNISTLSPKTVIYSKWDEFQPKDIFTHSTSWRPNSRTIAFVKDHVSGENRTITNSEVILVDMEGNTRSLYSVLENNSNSRYIEDISFSPDGRLIVLAENDWSNDISYLKILFIGDEDYCLVGVMEYGKSSFDTIRWSPRGDYIAGGQGGYELYFINVEIIFGRTYNKLECQ